MSKGRALVAANSYNRDQDWLVRLFQASGWSVAVTFGEFATQQALKREKDEGKSYDAFVITDTSMQLFTSEEHALPEALRLLGLDVHETGVRLCSFAKELGYAAEKIFCIDVAQNDETIERRVRELGVCYTDYDHAEARLRRMMEV